MSLATQPLRYRAATHSLHSNAAWAWRPKLTPRARCLVCCASHHAPCFAVLLWALLLLLLALLYRAPTSRSQTRGLMQRLVVSTQCFQQMLKGSTEPARSGAGSTPTARPSVDTWCDQPHLSYGTYMRMYEDGRGGTIVRCRTTTTAAQQQQQQQQQQKQQEQQQQQRRLQR